MGPEAAAFGWKGMMRTSLCGDGEGYGGDGWRQGQRGKVKDRYLSEHREVERKRKER